MQKTIPADVFDPASYFPRNLTRSQDSERELLETDNASTHKEWAEILELKASIDFDAFNVSVGGLLVAPTLKAPPSFVFGIAVKFDHAYDLARTINTFYDARVSGLRAILPPHISIKIHLGRRYDSSDRVTEMLELIEGCENESVVQLAIDEIGTTQQLTAEKKRIQRFAHLYVTYTPRKDKSAGDVGDIVEKNIKFITKTLGALKSVGTFVSQKIIGPSLGDVANRDAKAAIQETETRFREAYFSGFQLTFDILRQRMGLDVRAMDHDELLSNLRERFSGDRSGQSPHKINCKIDNSGVYLTEELRGQHIANWITKDSNVTLEDEGVIVKAWNTESERVKSDYISVLIAREKVPGWKHEYHQCSAIWSALSSEFLHDVEFFIDFHSSNQAILFKNSKDSYKQSLKRIEKAAKKGEFSAAGQRGLTEGAISLTNLDRSEKGLRASIVALIHAPSTSALDKATRQFQQDFSLVDMQREDRLSHLTWLQTLPCYVGEMCRFQAFPSFSKFVLPIEADFVFGYTCTQAIGLFPVAGTQAIHASGIELISQDGQPIYVDFFDPQNPVMWAFVGKQRQGKSYFGNKVADHALLRAQPVTIIDLPNDGGNSALKTRCNVLNGSEIDCREQSLNLLHLSASVLIPGVFDEKDRQSRMLDTLDNWLDLLMILGGPTAAQESEWQTTKDLLRIAIDLYICDPDIQRRYHAALTAGFGSPEWEATPTLADFRRFYQRETLQHKIGNIKGNIDDALNNLDMRLEQKTNPNTVIGRAIARPSTVDIDRSIYTVFSLRGLKLGSEEARAFVLGAYACAIQKSIGHLISHVVFEECNSAAEDPAIVSMMSTLVTRMGKAGVRCGFITNSFKKLAESDAGRVLLDNIGLKFFGPIDASSIELLSETMAVPVDMLQKCSAPTFLTDKTQGKMNILVSENGRNTITQFFPGWISSALNASHRFEGEAKRAFFQTIPDKNVALPAFSLYFRACCETGKAVRVLPPETIKDYEKLCQY
jgi:hypothetical protein